MVAARAANQVADVRPTPGSLLLAPREIVDLRWRLDAYVRLGPALHRCGLPLDRLRGVLREGMRGAVCPRPLRAGLEQLVLDHVERDRIGALAIAALWTRAWPAAALRAAAAHVAARDWRTAGRLAAGPGTSHALTALARDGCLAGEFVGDLRDAELYEATVPVVAALVEARDPRAEAIAARVKEREPAQVHVARLRGEARGIATPRGRSGAWLWIARDWLAAERFDDARAIADRIEMPMVRQYARLELARALVERGRLGEGLVELRRVVDPRLARERRVLFEEVRLAASHPETAWRHVELRAGSWRPHGWMLPAWALDAEQRASVCFGVYYVRHATRLDDPHLYESGGGQLRALADHRVARRAAIALAERLGIDVEVGLRGARRMQPGLDAFAAEHVAMRAERLVARPLEAAPPTDDPASLARALYDEHVALAQPSRRRVLIAVAQYALRSALVSPERWPREVIATRLRTLVHLGGSLASDAIAKALRTLPFRETVARDALIALAALDARTAARLALDQLPRLSRPFELLGAIEWGGGLPAGYARALGKLENRHITRAWVLELVAAWRARTGEVPSLDLIRQIGTRPQPIAELVERIHRAAGTLRGASDHVGAALALAATPALLADLAMCAPPRVDLAMRPWRSSRMGDLVRRAVATRVGAIVPHLVARVAKRLRSASLDPVQAFAVQGVRYQVRYLDKQRDLLTYLRFPDTPARSCYRSDQDWYFLHSRDELLRAWKDPLTLTFHVERERAGALEVCGFLFGNFADVDGRLGVVFNSLHTRPRSAAVREQVLRAVERIVAPFGIAHLGIANVHGGRGVLPADYVQRPVTLLRYRALSLHGELLRAGWDDLPAPNTRQQVTSLYWRALPTPPGCSGVEPRFPQA